MTGVMPARMVLDTNVLSELLRAEPNAQVLAWVAAQPPDRLFISVVTQAEMLLGARLLPAGQASHLARSGAACDVRRRLRQPRPRVLIDPWRVNARR